MSRRYRLRAPGNTAPASGHLQAYDTRCHTRRRRRCRLVKRACDRYHLPPRQRVRHPSTNCPAMPTPEMCAPLSINYLHRFTGHFVLPTQLLMRGTGPRKSATKHSSIALPLTPPSLSPLPAFASLHPLPLPSLPGERCRSPRGVRPGPAAKRIFCAIRSPKICKSVKSFSHLHKTPIQHFYDCRMQIPSVLDAICC